MSAPEPISDILPGVLEDILRRIEDNNDIDKSKDGDV